MSRLCRPTPPPPSAALVALATLALVTAAARASADSRSHGPAMPDDAHTGAGIEPISPPAARGLRTDRLSAKQRDRWRRIVSVVFAEDDQGRPLHPTLRKMWDEVAASGHEVHVELPDPTGSVRTTAGLFRIESVRPDGRIVAMLRLNRRTIDRVVVGEATPRGFRRFHGLGREERYAEVLGHELGHAVWALADPARARHQLMLWTRQEGLVRSLLKAEPGTRAEIVSRIEELGPQIDALETPARAAEARVWRELVASQAARGVPSASSSEPGLGTTPSRLSEGEVD